MYTRITNDKGNEVAYGTRGDGINKFYCGKYIGPDCGPDEGPQCLSCTRFTMRAPPNIVEIARLRANNKEYFNLLSKRRAEYEKDTDELRKELDSVKQKNLELQAKLDAKPGANIPDKWTLACEENWNLVYKALALRFHPDKYPLNKDVEKDTEKLEAFFKVLSDKNDTFNAKRQKI